METEVSTVPNSSSYIFISNCAASLDEVTIKCTSMNLHTKPLLFSALNFWKVLRSPSGRQELSLRSARRAKYSGGNLEASKGAAGVTLWQPWHSGNALFPQSKWGGLQHPYTVYWEHVAIMRTDSSCDLDAGNSSPTFLFPQCVGRVHPSTGSSFGAVFTAQARADAEHEYSADY